MSRISRKKAEVLARLRGEWTLPELPLDEIPRKERKSQREVEERSEFVLACKTLGAILDFEEWKAARMLRELEMDLERLGKEE